MKKRKIDQQPFSYNSHAKINLFLEINEKRHDGYHELRSIFQTVALHDRLTFSHHSSGIELSITGAFYDPSLYVDNIIEKTIKKIRENRKIGPGIKVHLEKNIPVASGLGGGSSNAFAAIKALNSLWDLEMSSEDMLSLSARMGSDVPFFFHGGTVLVEGRGEELTPLPDREVMPIIIVKPECSIPTHIAYSWLDEHRLKSKWQAHHREPILSCNISTCLYNDFEEVVFMRFPEVKRIKDMLLSCGCSGALLSGSGSSVFGVVDDFSKASVVAESMMKLTPGRVILTRTLRREDFVRSDHSGSRKT